MPFTDEGRFVAGAAEHFGDVGGAGAGAGEFVDEGFDGIAMGVLPGEDDGAAWGAD